MTVDELREFKLKTATELRAYAKRALDAADILDPGPRARRRKRKRTAPLDIEEVRAVAAKHDVSPDMIQRGADGGLVLSLK